MRTNRVSLLVLFAMLGSAAVSLPADSAAGGGFTGMIFGSDDNITAGNIRFTVNGSTVQGSASGKWTLGGTGGSYSYPVVGDYTGSFYGSYDSQTGKFDVPFSGTMAVYPSPTAAVPYPKDTTPYEFSGTLHGSIEGGQAQGAWSASYKWGSWTAKWNATGPAPKKAETTTGGSWVHTGPGNDADDYTWVNSEAPPGISGVGEVPGPADMGETGTGLLLPGLLAALGVGLKSMLDSNLTPPPMIDYGDSGSGDGSGDDSGGGGSEESTDDGPETSSGSQAAPAATGEPVIPDKGYGPEYNHAIKDAQDASDTYNAGLKQYADFQNGADKNDPQYQAMDQQYKDYLDYWKKQADSSSAGADAIATAVENQKNTQVLKDYWGNDKEVVYDPGTGLWHDAQTGNLFDPDKWQQTQQQIANDTAWSQADLQKISNRQDADSKALDQLIAGQKQRAVAAAYVSRIEQEGLKHDLWNPGGPGDLVDHSEQILNDIYAGKPIDWQAIKATRKYTGDSIKGAVMPESSLSNQPGYMDNLQDAAINSIREIATGKDADGKSTWAGTIASGFTRFTAAVATGGVSEAAYVAANMGYAEYDTAMHSKTFSALDVYTSGLTTGLVEAGPTVVGGAVMHYLPQYCPNVAKGLAEMMEPVGSAVKSLDGAVQSGAEKLGTRVSQYIKPLDESLLPTRSAVDSVLSSSDPKALSKLYSEGGMQKLAELQKAGGLTTDEAKLLNQQLAKRVNQSIEDGTADAISKFESRTGVKVKSVTLGDSGSSASGSGNPKIKTDFDCTHTTNLDSQDLANYAEMQSKVQGRPVSLANANRQLQEELGQHISENVDRHLRADGFARGVEDVDYKTYNGIGKAAGQGDCYPPGFTTNRMAVQGRGKIFEVGNDGSITTHKISGQAVVDQHGLNQRSMGVTSDVPKPDTFNTGEFKDFSAQQVQAVNSHSDVKSLAKAMGRESDLSTRLSHVADRASDPTYAKQLENAGLPDKPPQLDKGLVELSQKINKNPSNATEYLTQAGYNEDTYATAVRNQVTQYHAGIGGSLAS